MSAIRDAIKARLATISGLRTHDTIPGTIMAPAAIVMPGDPLIEFDDAFGRGGDTLNFVVLLLVQYADIRIAQDSLDAYLATSGAASVKAAVDGTLGDTVSDAVVTAVRNYGVQDYNGVEYLGAEFPVRVMV